MVLTLLETIPSGSHNAPWSEELGEHWPAGQNFKLLDKRRQATLKKFFHVGNDRVVVEQIGGEEVQAAIAEKDFERFFGVPYKG